MADIHVTIFTSFYNQEALLTLTDKHVQLITVARQQLLVVLQHGLQTCTAAFIISPVPVVIAQLFPVHPLPVTKGALKLQSKPKAGFLRSSGIEESEVLLFCAQDGEVDIVPLTKLPGFEPGHRSLEQEVL